jgi:hypothetical protein
VLVNGADVAPTNTPFTHSFPAVTIPWLPGVVLFFPTVTVRATGFPDATVDTGH